LCKACGEKRCQKYLPNTSVVEVDVRVPVSHSTFVEDDGSTYVNFNMKYHNGMNFTKKKMLSYNQAGNVGIKVTNCMF
jgi:hypothetical protein